MTRSSATVTDDADVMIVGNGVLGLSIAFALADRPESPRVAVVGKCGAAAASAAAGAMLGVLGEITGNSLRTAISTEKSEMALDAARCWPVPDGFVLHPELAPFAYETGPELLKVVTDYRTLRDGP